MSGSETPAAAPRMVVVETDRVHPNRALTVRFSFLVTNTLEAEKEITETLMSWSRKTGSTSVSIFYDKKSSGVSPSLHSP